MIPGLPRCTPKPPRVPLVGVVRFYVCISHDMHASRRDQRSLYLLGVLLCFSRLFFCCLKQIMLSFLRYCCPPWQAISSLLKDEMDKVNAGAESERRGAMLKKFKRVERRSGGLCNPDLLEKVVRSSSGHGPSSRPSSPAAHPSHQRPPPSDPKGLGAATPTPLSNLVVVDVEDDPDAAAAGSGAVASQDQPWAEDMLCRGVRKRHAAILRTRGRALAKGLARMLKGVSQELKGVAARLPPWEEEEEGEEERGADEVRAAGKGRRRCNVRGRCLPRIVRGWRLLARRHLCLCACLWVWGQVREPSYGTHEGRSRWSIVQFGRSFG